MALFTSQGQPCVYRAAWVGGDCFGRTSVPDAPLGWAAEGSAVAAGDNLGAYRAMALWPCISPEAVSSLGTPAEKQGQPDFSSHFCPCLGHLPTLQASVPSSLNGNKHALGISRDWTRKAV